MNYKKIAEIAHECEVKRKMISEYLLHLGGRGGKLDQGMKDEIDWSINRLESEQTALENKLRKLIKE